MHQGETPIVALLCIGDMRDFLANTLAGLLKVSIDPDRIVIGCRSSDRAMVERVVGSLPCLIQEVPEEDPRGRPGQPGFASFGSTQFTDVSWMKIAFIRDLLTKHSHVIFSDLDIGWLRNPLPYLIEVARRYPIALQTECQPVFPPKVCCGFMSFTQDAAAMKLLDLLLASDEANLASGERVYDQLALQTIIESDEDWLARISFLPETLFPVGIAHALVGGVSDPVPMRGTLEPFLFHANWTIGAMSKRDLLERTGTWIVSDAVEFINTPPQLAVVYPAFDVRGDEASRIRMWTRQQDAYAGDYVLVVVTPSTNPEVHGRIRQELRDQDMLLVEPGAGREADFWNVGAAATSSPWIMFTEGHAMPHEDCLSALVAWTKAHPDGDAANCVVQNPGDHRVSQLMERWFGDMQTRWARNDTWPRLHRAAFAIRRTVFDALGPFEAQYGQFAPPLLSARLHESGRSVVTVPDSIVIHDDSPLMSAHHSDTRDYVRGEAAARSDQGGVRFDAYFGTSPASADLALVPTSEARASVRGLFRLFLADPLGRTWCATEAWRLVPQVLLPLDQRIAFRRLVIRVDEVLIGHTPLPKPLLWRQFLRAHARVVRTEQLIRSASDHEQVLSAAAQGRTWSATELGPDVLVGVHSVESFEGRTFRWTRPFFLLRLEVLTEPTVLTLDTGGIRPGLRTRDIAVVAGFQPVPQRDVILRSDGVLLVQLPHGAGPMTIRVSVRGLRERTVSTEGRLLGLPIVRAAFLPAVGDTSGRAF